jgi:tetratricopeptide (TPR) repeat protein
MTSDPDMALLGEGHQQVADDLLARFAAVSDGDGGTHRVVLLEGESGAGKTRIVRELYERVRAEERWRPLNDDGQGYWPSLADFETVGSVPGREAMPERKVLRPPREGFVRPAETLPGFFWWALTCDQHSDGGLSVTVRSLLSQVESHLDFLIEAYQQRVSRGVRAKHWMLRDGRTVAAESAKDTALESMSHLLDATAGVVPVAGLAFPQMVRAAQAFRERRRRKGTVRQGGSLADPDEQAAQELYEIITRLCLPGVPWILVIEDMHLMDAGLADLLDLIAQKSPQTPLFVVGTAWSEGSHREQYADWKSAALEQDLATVIPAPGLPMAARIDLARRYARNSSSESLGLVAERWSNPLALILAMTDAALRRRYIEDERLTITEADKQVLTRFPKDIKGLYQRRWEELPDDVKQALMLAAGCLPSGDNSGEGELWPFIASVVGEAALRCGLLDDIETAIAALGKAVDPFEWASQENRELDLAQFKEWVLLTIAREAFDNDFPFEAENDDLPTATATVLVDWFESLEDEHDLAPGHRDVPEQQLITSAAEWLLALQPNAGKHSRGGALATVAIAMAEADVYHYRNAVTLLQDTVLENLFSDSPAIFATQDLLGRWLRELGEVAAAVDVFRGLLADHVRVLGPGHLDTLMTRSNLAGALGELGEVAAAVDIFRGLLADEVRVLGPGHPDTLMTRNNLAGALGELGEVAAAVDIFLELLADEVRVLGPGHPDTLRTRNNLAVTLRELGEVAAAVDMYRELVGEYLRVLGPDHPSTLRTRNNLAMALEDLGDTAGAVR